MKRGYSLAILLLCVLVILLFVGCRPTARTYLDDFKTNGDKYGVEVSWLLAVAKQESGFDKDAVSSAGARGLMQLLPSTAKWIAELMDWEYQDDLLFDASYNIRLGTWYVHYLRTKFDGDWWIAAYNAGEGRVSAWIADGLKIEDIPFAETRHYIKKVKEYQHKYSALGYDK